VILTLLILVVIYFMVFFFSFKYKVLGYFAELEKETIQISELCANEFQRFINSDDYDLIRKNQQVLKEYEIAKTKNNVNEMIAKQR